MGSYSLKHPLLAANSLLVNISSLYFTGGKYLKTDMEIIIFLRIKISSRELVVSMAQNKAHPESVLEKK